MHSARALAALILLGLGTCPSAAAANVVQGRSLVDGYDAAVRAFRERIDAYIALHKRAAAMVPPIKETDDPAKITAREQGLGEAIRRLRPSAAPGDIFGADLAPYIRKAIQADWAKRSTADQAGLVKEIPPGSVADVNSTYPPALPLATFPPRLLAALPPLPEGLEYRFVGRHLILRDVKANLIIDVIARVLPGSQA